MGSGFTWPAREDGSGVRRENRIIWQGPFSENHKLHQGIVYQVDLCPSQNSGLSRTSNLEMESAYVIS